MRDTALDFFNDLNYTKEYRWLSLQIYAINVTTVALIC